jgi:hypothetical protein
MISFIFIWHSRKGKARETKINEWLSGLEKKGRNWLLKGKREFGYWWYLWLCKFIQISRRFCCGPVLRVLASTGQRIGSWGSRLTHETTRSAHKVGFIREEGKAALEMDGEPGKSVASPCCLHRGLFYLVLLLGRTARSQKWSGLLTHLCRNIYTVLWQPAAYRPCGILRHPRCMTCEAACPFTGCRAHSALMGDGGIGSFLSSDPPRPNSLKPARANSSWDPIWKNTLHKKGLVEWLKV